MIFTKNQPLRYTGEDIKDVWYYGAGGRRFLGLKKNEIVFYDTFYDDKEVIVKDDSGFLCIIKSDHLEPALNQIEEDIKELFI